ncbi:hypothetical protein ANN_09390 [Periplaneta americana]|uniref:Uncharacterized protein n=1 Tax=Periplaneta americana TaxID=6978 RepID=A0ABQ8TL70_PERAM|nr:hypothetical protein ANN_09390 [Periplaneta americana]
MDWREVGYDGREWINFAQDRDLCESGNEPPASLKNENNALRESAMRISYKIFHDIELKTFNEGNFIKRCLILLVDELCPQQVGEMEAIRLSRRTVVRRLQRVFGGSTPPLTDLFHFLTQTFFDTPILSLVPLRTFCCPPQDPRNYAVKLTRLGNSKDAAQLCLHLDLTGACQFF